MSDAPPRVVIGCALIEIMEVESSYGAISDAILSALTAAGYVVVPRGEVSDVIAWLLLALNAQQLQAATSDRLISLTARNQRREIGDIIADAQRFRASLPAAPTGAPA